ncbi:MAG: endo-1,4-beta-xylanase [Coleofasciculus sp. C1-SOL-03]|uniref:endo-1,4-beta-xylanase n=1 Tax=Coleofasciculus sp. C1-SOL-03 TaxID=3069522 RepID=UPI0032FA1957
MIVKGLNKYLSLSALILLGLTVTLLFSIPAISQPGDITLRSLAQEQNVHIGAAVSINALRNDPTYREVLAREFNMVTPENVMKIKPIHPERDRYDFTAANEIVAFAKAHQMQIRGHTLVWHRSLPDWLTETEWTREELIDILRRHIFTVVSHYRGDIVAWDVVNEAVGGKDSLRKTIWQQGIGSDYVELAFRWAHEADPNALLFYNDYGGEGLGEKSDAIYAFIKDLLEKDVPIHGVGLQMHKSIKNPPKPEDVATNIKRLEELGLEVHITEMDVQIHNGTGTEEERLVKQAKVYQDMLGVCLKAPNCTAFVTWGFTDKFTWIPSFVGQPDLPLIFDKSYRPKPAYQALVEVLSTAKN